MSLRELASVDILFHKWVVIPFILVYQKTIMDPRTPNLQLTILQQRLILMAKM